MKYQTQNFLKAIFLGALLVLPFTAAKAFVIGMDTEFSGADAPTGSAPWVIFTVEDSTTAGTVNFTIDAAGLVASEFIGGFWFNYDGGAGDVAVSSVDLTALSSAVSLTLPGYDSFKADGGGYYDFLWSFTNGDFTGGESISFSLSASGLTADMFNVESVPSGGNGTWVAAAHVQGIDNSGCGPGIPDCQSNTNGSGFISGRGTTDVPVPEPGSLALLGLGLLGLALGRRKA